MLPTLLPDRWPNRIPAQALIRVVREYFRYHGLWAPGVRLLRDWSVSRKILTVLGIMALPLLVLTFEVVTEQNEMVFEVQRQAAGARVAAAVGALDAAMAAERSVLLEGRPGAAAPVRTALDALQGAVRAAGAAGLDLRDTSDAADTAASRVLANAGAAPTVRLEALAQAAAAVALLHEDAVRQSGVTVTRDSRLLPRAQLAFDTLPHLQADVNRLEQAARAVAPGTESAAGTPAEQLARQFALAGAHAQTRQAMEMIERSLALLPSRGEAPAGAAALPALRAVLDDLPPALLTAQPSAPATGLLQALGGVGAQLQTLRAAQEGEALKRLHGLDEEARDARTQVLAMMLACLLLALYLVYAFFLVMRGGLRTLNHQMRRMAEGDLSVRPMPRGQDEVAETMSAMTTSLARLSDLLASVRQSVASGNHAASQIATGNADLSQHNRHTNDGVAEVVQGVQRYTSQLEACGRQVGEVLQIVHALRLEAERNRRQMTRLRERMTSLRGKSREIGEAVMLIDAVAFRTNILALNASVEAAKAGEVGRGFAVVAQEVRSLAKRSAESARRIGDIVGRSSEDIELSGALAEETGEALARTDLQVDRIHTAMNDVARLTRSGEAESSAILESVMKVHGDAQKNTSLVEQLAHAAHALRSQGERLAHKLDAFKLS